MRLKDLREASAWPDVIEISHALETLSGPESRREYIRTHHDEVAAACRAYDKRLELVAQLAALDEVYDPPTPPVRQWHSLHYEAPVTGILNGDAQALILRAYLGLEDDEREPLSRLIDSFAMLCRWRQNQTLVFSTLRGLSATDDMESYFGDLMDRGDLSPAEAARIAAALKGAPTHQELMNRIVLGDVWRQVGRFSDYLDHPEAPFGRPLSSGEKRDVCLGILNLPLTYHEFLRHNVDVLGLLKAGKSAEAQKSHDAWTEELAHGFHGRNRMGVQILRQLPVASLDSSRQDAREAAFAERLRKLAAGR